MKKRTFLSSSLAAFGLIATLGTAVAAPLPADIKSGNYVIEPTHTQIGFSLLHFGFTNYNGLFSDASGTLKFNPKHLDKTKLDVSLKIDSVQTTSARLTDELKSADWFDATQFPTATFVSTTVTQTGEGEADIAGNLTIHGVTKPATLHARFIGSGVNPMDKAYTIGFEGTTTVKRSDFGVSKYVPMVGDDVTLTIAGAFEKK
ncbi:YceI family protein [Acetobacter sp.]|jgi:polyisoprenoid-binding protein YceI|uniref:YceI family protein n=1 Tax=Acetobacter sp. TaxID=440 RepID=UPI0025C6F794|nr:YceI family protein [Acetobacter sp.]MCH4090005.1 YceI family protein [Acetobacter sp.]MCI1298701.1 YceI family protein [Acetobacter sp.]MCI1315266.1 YceI family protein [Acetobacter sp.]